MRREVKQKIFSIIGEHKDTAELQRVAYTLYNTDNKGRAMNYKNEKTIPENWRHSWHKTNKETRMEQTEGRAAEVVVKLGNIAPLWTGVLTKAFTWLIKDIVPQKRKKFIKNYRTILQEFAAETWLIRCEKTYDPKLEAERYKKTCIMKKQKSEAKNIIKKLKFTGGITTEQIMNMSKIQQDHFVTENTSTWTQRTLSELNFSMVITEKKINSRTQSGVQHHSITVKKQTQTKNPKQWDFSNEQ